MESLVHILMPLLIGAVLTLVCVCVQTVSNIALLYWMLRRFAKAEQNFALVWRVWVVVRLIFAFIGIHLTQIGTWAIGYLFLGCFSSLEEALYFSFASFSTSEAGESTLPKHWRLLGPFEGLNGIIAVGLSIGFMFTVISRLQESRVQRQQESQQTE